MRSRSETQYETQRKFFKPVYTALNYFDDQRDIFLGTVDKRPWLKNIFDFIPLTVLKTSDDFGDLRSASEAFELNDTSFRRGIHRFKNVLVNYYAPWCVHCARFAQTYDEVASIIQATESFNSTLVAKMDATIHPRIVERHDIHAFPSILLYVDGDIDNAAHYMGSRHSYDLIKWVEETAANPPISRFYGFAQNPRFHRNMYEVNYRIGDVVHLASDESDRPHLGVIVGWDCTAQVPDGWFSSDPDAAENKMKPHYRVLWDVSRDIPLNGDSALGKQSAPNVNYIRQDKLYLHIGQETKPIVHPQMDKHFLSDIQVNRYTPKNWLHSQYPEDIKF
eukprot:CFRG1217T1